MNGKIGGLSFVLLALVAGCGGGGGGSAGGSTTIGSFVKWSAVPNPGSVKISGDATYTSYTAPAPAFLVTSVDPVTQTPDASVTITYRSDGTISAIDLSVPATPSGVMSIRWDENGGDSIVETTTHVIASDAAGSTLGISANAIPRGWEYQTFGMWLTGYGTGSGTFGGVSVGAQTAASAVPTTGSAIFNGSLLGGYIDASGQPWLVDASLTANVDFASRSVSLTSSGSVKYNVNNFGSAGVSDSSLDITGTLTYSPATNSFSGTLSTAGGLNGVSSGRFYGPSAEELGGTFHFTQAGSVETFIGAYGAKR